MYLSHWKLREKPFNNTPDPEFFYFSTQHEDALMKLSYVVTENAGAGMLSGIFGCGKTAIANALMHNLRDSYRFSYISYPHSSPEDLLRSIVRSLVPDALPDVRSELLMDSLLQKLKKFIQDNTSSGYGAVIIIDEAHLIKDLRVLESLRLLLNFQTEKNFLLSVILIGQPELTDTVDSVKQLRQRIAVHCKVGRMNEEDTMKYIQSRLKAAGAEHEIFAPDAVKAIYEATSGIPRNINRVCELALFKGFADKLEAINGELIRKTIQEFGIDV